MILRVRVISSILLSNAANLRTINFPHYFHLFSSLWDSINGIYFRILLETLNKHLCEFIMLKNIKKWKRLCQYVLLFYSFNGKDQVWPKSPPRTLDFIKMNFTSFSSILMYFKHLWQVLLLYDRKHARNLVFKFSGKFTRTRILPILPSFDIRVCCRSE